MIIAIDFPKIESPFVREGENHLVIPTINPGYEWVFEDPAVMCVEKIDGTNISIIAEEGRLQAVWNRANAIPCGTLDVNHYMEGVRHSYNKGYFSLRSGQHFGELVGPKLQRDPLGVGQHVWYPFEYLKEKATYRSFHKYEKNFANLSSWFQNDIFSLMYARLHAGVKTRPEGVVFWHPDGRMAKLRLDMFEWHKGPRHKEAVAVPLAT